MSFVIGQSVVCIDDVTHPEVRKLYTDWIKEGETYVVRNVVLGTSIRNEPGEICIYLVGKHNPLSSTPPYPERGYNAERFKPLLENEDETTNVNIDENELVEV